MVFLALKSITQIQSFNNSLIRNMTISFSRAFRNKQKLVFNASLLTSYLTLTSFCQRIQNVILFHALEQIRSKLFKVQNVFYDFR